MPTRKEHGSDLGMTRVYSAFSHTHRRVHKWMHVQHQVLVCIVL